MDRKVDNQSRVISPAFCLKLLISFQLFQLPELEFPVLGDYSGCKRISYSLMANEEKDITIYRGAGLLIIGSASAPNVSFYTVPFWNQSSEGQELPLAFGSRQAYTPKITVKECRSATQVILTFKNLNDVAYNGTFILLYTR